MNNDRRDTYINPAETGLYYLGSRYYNPELCRFISADGYVSTGQSLIGCNMYIYCLNNPVMYVDTSGNRAVKCDARESLSDAIEGLTAEDAAYVLGVDNTTNLGWVNAVQAKRNDNRKEKKNKRKGFENRQPTGDRERNVGHPNGEEHSRVPKGNRGGRRKAVLGLGMTSLVILYILANNATFVGVSDDFALVPTVKIWWDYASMLMK